MSVPSLNHRLELWIYRSTWGMGVSQVALRGTPTPSFIMLWRAGFLFASHVVVLPVLRCCHSSVVVIYL
jgi:hypothetical protein